MIAAATSTDFYRPWWKVAGSKASWTLKCFKCPGNFDLPIYTTILAKRLAIRREIGILFPDHDLMTDLQTSKITIKTNQSADAISKTQLSGTPSEIPADYTGVFCSCCFVTHLHVTVEPKWQKAMHGNFHWRYCQWQVTVWLFYTFSIVFPFYEFRSWLSHLSHLSPKCIWYCDFGLKYGAVGSRSKSRTGCRSGHQGRLYGLENQEMQEGCGRLESS